MFIHEEYDDLVTLEDVHLLFARADNYDNQVWQIKSADHSEGYTKDPGAFVDAIESFLKGCLDSPEP
jgi:hypothetical protein